MTSIPHATPSTSETTDGHSATTTTMEAVERTGTTPVRPRLDSELSNHGRASRSPETRRKRLSFFGRSSSDASTRKPLPQLQVTLSTPRGEVTAADSSDPTLSQTRPGTSGSEHHVRRKTTDHLESIRNSIFGAKKLASHGRPIPKRSRHSHQVDARDINNANTDLMPFTNTTNEARPQSKGNAGGQIFKDENDFYHHRKKTSISSPYDFKHVMHTSKKHLPRLDTVDEKELSLQLNEAGLRPQRNLRGISADVLDPARLRETSNSPKRVVSRAGTPAGLVAMSDSGSSKTRNDSGVDETTFDETQETKFNPAEHFHNFRHSRSEEKTTLRSPRHVSSSPALNSSPASSSVSHTIQHLRNKASSDDMWGRSSSPSAASANLEANLGQSPEMLSKLQIRSRPAGQSFREKQPLPPLPGLQQLTKKPSKGTVGSRTSLGQLFPPPRGSKIEYPSSVVSKRSSKSAATTRTSGSRATDILEEPNWEDDIDFAFEQEAEATCDFDWGQVAPSAIAHDEGFLAQCSPDEDDSNGSGGVRLSAWIGEPSALTSKTVRPDSVGTGVSTPDPNTGQHKRGSSVGHRGFQAARNASSDKLTKTPPLSVEIVSEQVSSSLPPTFSLTGTDVDSSKSPYTSGSYFPAVDSGISEYLSDPESTRPGGSKHRKSSSYGSFDSSGRSLQSLQAASESTRWSTASTSSIPDLMHSHRKQSRNSIRKSLTAVRPLESVPHSPGIDEPEKPALAERPTQWDRGVSDGILMRRPATPGDRALLFNSGRVVQRGRSATPSRMAVTSLPPYEQEGGWI